VNSCLETVHFYALTRSVKEKTTTDEEVDERKEPDQKAGKRKGMCCTPKGIKAQRLKRVFNRAAQVGPPRSGRAVGAS
jgi:hypothetical protein